MNNFNLRSISLEALRGFKRLQVIENLPLKGLILVDGKSGSGKTALFSSINYTLNCSQFPETELQSFLTDKKIQTELSILHNNDLVNIRRGKEYSITKNDITFKGSAKSVSEEVLHLFGIDSDLLYTLSYKQQDHKSTFLSMTDSEKKKFLSKLLKLEEIEENIKTSSKKCSPLEKEIYEIGIRKETLERNLEIPIKPVYENHSKDIFKLEDLNKELFEVNVQLTEINDKIDSTQNNFLSFNEDLFLIQYKDQLNELELHDEILQRDRQEIVVSTQNKEKDLLLLKTEIKKEEQLIGQKNDLLNGKCPYCLQDWLKDSSKTSLDRINNQLNIIMEFKEKYDKIKLELKGLNLKSTENNELIKINNENIITIKNLAQEQYHQNNREKQFKFKEIIKELKDKRTPLLELYSNISKEIYEINSKLKLDKEKRKFLDLEYNKKLKHYDDAKNELNILCEFISDKQKQLNEEKDFIELCKGFLGKIFEEVLNEISYESNLILQNISNVSDVTINFDIQKVNKDDTIRQEIKLNVIKNGYAMNYKMLSGGQQTALSLAVDLSLSKVISRRTGISINWLILDEPFIGLNSEDIEHCLELLKTISEEKLIFVVDHHTETKEYFNKVITVKTLDGVSEIIQ